MKKRHTHSISLCPIVSPLPGCLCTWQPAPTARPLQMAAKVASSWSRRRRSRSRSSRRRRRALINQGRCLAHGGPGQGQEPTATLFQVLYNGFWTTEQVLALICTFLALFLMSDLCDSEEYHKVCQLFTQPPSLVE